MVLSCRRRRGPEEPAVMAELAADTAAVPRAVFTVADLPERERYDAWKESIACIFDVDADPEDRDGDFFAAIDASMYGPLMLARTTSRAQHWERSAATIARDGMDHYMIQYYETGSQTVMRSEEHKSELQSLMRHSYA